MALKGNQHKIDANKNNKIDAHDFKILRAQKEKEKANSMKYGKQVKEESKQEETILEYESKEGVYRHKGTYGYEGKGAEHGQTDYKKADAEERAEDKQKGRPSFAKKLYGARQNYVRSRKVSGKTYESFTGMMDDYKEQGIKGLFEALKKKKDMMEEVEVEQEEVQQIEQIEERTLTEPEMKKKEEVVMSMKKNLSGFKQRYGDKAKSVMYATATKIAKKD